MSGDLKRVLGVITQAECNADIPNHTVFLVLEATRAGELVACSELDAAVAFLEAVLPKCQWQLISNDADDASKARAKLLTFNMMYFTAIADTPARALLLATLDALIARAE